MISYNKKENNEQVRVAGNFIILVYIMLDLGSTYIGSNDEDDKLHGIKQ